MPSILVYGATGFTGQLVAEHAAAIGLDVVVASRREGALRQMAGDREVRAFSLANPEAVRRGLKDVRCVINAAGPFAATMQPVLDGCLAVGAHYLDTSGELPAFADAMTRDDEAKRAGVMVMPGAGWDVVATDSAAWATARRVAAPRVLRLAIWHNEHHIFSHGSARTMNLVLEQDQLWRQDGELVDCKGAPPREFDPGSGARLFYPFPMADAVSSWWSLRIPTIEVYGVADLQRARPTSEEKLARAWRGPDSEARTRIRSVVIAEVEGDDGQVARSRLETVGGHEFTALATLDIARRCLEGDYVPGYQSPTSAYGGQLLESIPGTELTELS